MSNSVHQNPQSLVSDDEQLQRSSPTRRVAAYHSDLELMERSQAFLDVMKQVDRVSDSSLPVLLTGEPGTGKQLVACAIHQRSPRRDQPFVAIHCGVVSPDAVATTLFGTADRPSLWEKVDGGTLFLDEITEIDSSLQSKLLRVLQQGEINRAGFEDPQKVNVRVIAASNRDLEQEVAAGRFRYELFHALRALSIVLPPLQTIDISGAVGYDQSFGEDWVTLSEIEGRYVARVLNYTGGNKQAAARILSVDRKTLDRMIKRHHIIYPHVRHRAKASAGS
jgi:DNA-binding NtrC family response regulator